MKYARKLATALAEPFRSSNGYDASLVVVFLVINCLVSINGCLHDPRVGYDARQHLAYIEALSKFQLVTPSDSAEFFSPPLPYALPALVLCFTGMTAVAFKFAQFLNVFLSIGLTWYLIKACRIISSRPCLKLGTLMFLGIVPVYYKTFAYVRGEPYVVCFAAVILYYVVLIFVRKRFILGHSIILGVTMGLCALSRQWGIFLFPAVFLFGGFQWIRYRQWRRAIARCLCLCLLLSSLIGGWFYAVLQFRYGSATAFNRKPAASFSFGNQPTTFYVGLGAKSLFDSPIRPAFPNQLLPIFYSEVWGDYWGYFTLYGKDTRVPMFVTGPFISEILSQGSRPYWLETNYETIGAYLGRVNFVSIFPSAVALAALVFAIVGILQIGDNGVFVEYRREVTGFLLLATAATVAGYFWFLMMYPDEGKGDTIKATYVLQAIPFVAIIVGTLLESIKEKAHRAYVLIVSGLCLTFAHNLSAMVTHYSLFHLYWPNILTKL